MVEKFDGKIVRLGELLRITIPPEIVVETDVADQTPVTIYINEEGNIEIEIEGGSAGPTMCAICGRYEASKKCINCSRRVCSKCFWMFGSLCKKCAKKV